MENEGTKTFLRLKIPSTQHINTFNEYGHLPPPPSPPLPRAVSEPSHFFTALFDPDIFPTISSGFQIFHSDRFYSSVGHFTT